MNKRFCLLASVVVVFILATFLSAPAQESFYKGKTIRVVVATAAGGGFDTYTRVIVRDDPTVPVLGVTQVSPTGPTTDMGWEIYPDHLYEGLTRITRDYGAPEIYITENGAAFNDEVVNGTVDDPQRIDYLRTHLSAAHRAIEDGVKLLHVVLESQRRIERMPGSEVSRKRVADGPASSAHRVERRPHPFPSPLHAGNHDDGWAGALVVDHSLSEPHRRR